MCGIFGLIATSDSNLGEGVWHKLLKSLFLLSESRGKEAAGIAIANSEQIVVYKDSISAKAMLKTAEYKSALKRGVGSFFDRSVSRDYLAAIGHARLVTNGLQGIDKNNQPIHRDDLVIVHNGIVVNVDELWRENEDLHPTADVDSEVIAALIHKYRKNGKISSEALTSVFDDIYGETSIAYFEAGGEEMILGTNTGSIYYCLDDSGTAFFFASELQICQKLKAGKYAILGFENSEVHRIPAGHGMTVKLSDLSSVNIDFAKPLPSPAYEALLQTQRKVEEKSALIEDALKNMRRCTKCLLPETMPYIVYDSDGICNFCHAYVPWKSNKRSEEELLEVLDRHRSNGGTHDCVMAFSGGRDSSAGLHILKEKYGMNPIAFTYDWGMVTDLARRNQARLCGKLGVEHIWISADIKKKRSNIRRNVQAWLKKPDLGIIPLFMAGDKQLFYHANRIMDETGISTMALCTNQYEKTDFKTGFLNVNSLGATIHKPSSLPTFAKANMIWQYGKRFISNPRYINRSIPDTASAFFAYYAIKQEYFSLFDYVPWDEDEIDELLIGEYGWELSDDAKSSWRIGDGTAPFYNYIYHSVAGFTESDTFRSNQIREGVLTREEGKQKADLENLPRWKSIREYMMLINVDFDEAIRVIDRIPKLYL